MSYIQFSQLHHFHQLVQEHQHHPVRRINTVMILNQAICNEYKYIITLAIHYIQLTSSPFIPTVPGDPSSPWMKRSKKLLMQNVSRVSNRIRTLN
jgi:hypothetical protein